MITTTSLIELFQIVSAEHKEPHRILGMHEVKCFDKKCVAVRVFLPYAKAVFLKDINGETKTYELNKIHEDGFFELVLEDRAEWFPYKLVVDGYDNKKQEIYDPYSFLPTVSEYDRYLFAAGNHYKIYEKLGSHLISINGVEGVSFAVWAPNAKSVSLIGDFNGWNENIHQMRILGMSGIWEIFIPELQEFEKYKYCIKTNGGEKLNKTDPYGNYCELRPNTASIVYNLNNYLWNDNKWIKDRTEKDILKSPVNIYEMHLGSWSHILDGNERQISYLEASEKLVKYILEMGYTHIEFLPLEEHPYDGSWGYQVTGYYAPTSRYGTPNEFKHLIDICHRNNIGVILDWVPAHFPKDLHGLARFDGTPLYEHEDPRKGEQFEWGTYIFNFEKNEVKNFLIANAIYWIEEFHIDGLRVDAVASMLYLDYGKNGGQWIPNERGGRENLQAEEFIKHMNSIISKKFDKVMLIAEESTSWAGVSKPVDYGGLGFTFKWNMGWMNDFLDYIKIDPLFKKYFQNKITFSMMYAYSENFILPISHDEVVHEKCSLINKMPGDEWKKFAGVRVTLGFMYGHPGKKLLFMGNEFGQISEWSEERSLDWHLLNFEPHFKLKNFVKDLNKLYKNEPDLWEMDTDPYGFSWINCNDNERSVLSFFRRSSKVDSIIIFVCNFTPQAYNDYRIGVPISGKYVEILNSDDLKYGGSGIINSSAIFSEKIYLNDFDNSINVSVPPLGVSVFKLVFKY